MESLRGPTAAPIDGAAFVQTVAHYRHVLLDLGTGDGRFVQRMARLHPTWYVIGVDACRENLRRAARTAPNNAQYLVANALALPQALRGVATHITINFPWGSLLGGLLDSEAGLVAAIVASAQPEATVEIRLNAGALAEAGWSFIEGGAQVHRVLTEHGFRVQPPVMLDTQALRACPTTWAHRLAFGRDPRAWYLRAACRVRARAPF